MPSHAPSQKIRIAMFTPWDQVCGNAEYAKRLVAGLERFSSVDIHEMWNISDRYDEHGRYLTRAALRSHFNGLRQAAKSADCDVVHVQHEYAFFGRSPVKADREFRSLVRQVRRPLVVTLHTFLPSLIRGHFRGLPRRAAGAFMYWHRTRHFREALDRAAAIVLHSGYTQRQFLAAFPQFRAKVRMVPIAIEAVPPRHTDRWFKSHGEKWIVIPGFVSAYKGHGQALRTLKLLPEQYRLVVAGGLHPKDPSSSEMWMHVLAMMDELGLRDRVTITGFIEDPAEQSALFSKADAFLLPYREVGQSGSAALADVLAYGQPVVTSLAKSMFVYRMDSDTLNACVSADADMPEALAAALVGSVEGQGSLHNREHQRTACARYSLERTAAAYEAIYREIMNPLEASRSGG